MQNYDAIVIGGGPAGSSAAARLIAGGLRVAILDRASFPRVKLCAGWLSEPIWDALELSPESYPRGLWKWESCHVHFRGRQVRVAARGYFIRRCEFDDFLLRRSGAEVFQHSVKSIEREGGDWVIDRLYRAPVVVGAGGTHDPLARLLAPRRTERPVGAQELELEADPALVAVHRIGGDGEPELLLHDDFGGYSWNVPKTDWLNVGCGTMDAKKVRSAWEEARAHFASAGHLPPGISERLERDSKGHSYYLFDPAHLESCGRDGAYLVGDALGLAQPLTAEGILPAVVSGTLAASAILAGDPSQYRRTLAAHPIGVDYDLYYRLRMALSRIPRGAPNKDASSGTLGTKLPGGGLASAAAAHALARAFGWMFAGRPIPGGRVLQKLIGASA